MAQGVFIGALTLQPHNQLESYIFDFHFSLFDKIMAANNYVIIKLQGYSRKLISFSSFWLFTFALCDCNQLVDSMLKSTFYMTLGKKGDSTGNKQLSSLTVKINNEENAEHF